jgi:hypothetical protein
MKTHIKRWLPCCLLLLLAACDDMEELTPVEILSNGGKVWRVVALQREGGTPVAPQALANLQVVFNSNGPNPTTYEMRGFGRTGILTDGDKPNFFSSTNSGNWEVRPGRRLVFDPQSPQASEVELLGEIRSSADAIRLRWQVPEELDKNIPVYQMTLQKTQ